MRGNWPAGGHAAPVREFLEHAGQHRLDRVEDVFLRDEAHLEVELVELARRAVGARVLVAKARGDLEVAVEPGDHQQLLEHLRRLRKRIELPRVHAARHQVVARALGAGRGQDRSLELGEALLGHPPPQRSDHLAAQHHVAVDALAPEVEEAVLEADVLGVLLLAGDGHRQFLSPALHDDAAREDLDLSGRQVRVDRCLAARLDRAVDRDDALEPQVLEHFERRGIGVRDDLGDAVMIAQVDEQHAAVIALAVHPARQADGLADVLGAQRGAGVGTIGVHFGDFRVLGNGARLRRRRRLTQARPAFVKACAAGS